MELSKTEAEIYGWLPTFKGHAAQFGSTAPNRRLRGGQRSVSPGIGSAHLPSMGLIQSVMGSHFPCRRVNPICFASLIPRRVQMRAQPSEVRQYFSNLSLGQHSAYGGHLWPDSGDGAFTHGAPGISQKDALAPPIFWVSLHPDQAARFQPVQGIGHRRLGRLKSARQGAW